MCNMACTKMIAFLTKEEGYSHVYKQHLPGTVRKLWYELASEVSKKNYPST